VVALSRSLAIQSGYSRLYDADSIGMFVVRIDIGNSEEYQWFFGALAGLLVSNSAFHFYRCHNHRN
jgi:hypothetical protein